MLRQKEDFVYHSTYLLRFRFESQEAIENSMVLTSVFSFVDLPDVSNPNIKDKSIKSLLSVIKHANHLHLSQNESPQKYTIDDNPSF